MKWNKTINTHTGKSVGQSTSNTENFNEQSELKKLYLGAACTAIGVFVFAILFYIGIFVLIFNSYKLYKATGKAKYLYLSILSAILFIVLQGFVISPASNSATY